MTNIYENEYITANQASKIAGISQPRFTVLKHAGRVPEPAARVSGKDVYLRSDVEAWAEARSKKPGHKPKATATAQPAEPIPAPAVADKTAERILQLEERLAFAETRINRLENSLRKVSARRPSAKAAKAAAGAWESGR